MSFRFSSGTIDSMAGVFAAPKKYRLGSGGGSPKAPKAGGTVVGLAVASIFPKPASTTGGSRPSVHAKHAFGGGTQVRMSGRAVMTMDRTSRRVPEVVVRITGRQHGGGHVLANFAYISRLGHGPEKELGLETSDGEVLRDGRDMQILAQDWHEWEMDGDARRKGATSISMILSMPTGTDPEKLKAAAVDFAKEQFANRSWVAGLHVDRDHPHVTSRSHAAISTVGASIRIATTCSAGGNGSLKSFGTAASRRTRHRRGRGVSTRPMSTSQSRRCGTRDWSRASTSAAPIALSACVIRAWLIRLKRSS